MKNNPKDNHFQSDLYREHSCEEVIKVLEDLFEGNQNSLKGYFSAIHASRRHLYIEVLRVLRYFEATPKREDLPWQVWHY